MKRKSHISIIIIMISLSLFCSYHIYYHFLNKSSDELVKNYYAKELIHDETKLVIQKINNEVKEEYLGIIKIPKINLVEGFYNINSKNNNINKSVTILKESNDEIIYLTAHSGSGYLAFFQDLDKLNIDDFIYIDINGNTYQYVINNIYEEDKNGLITINHNINEKYLVLTTCSKNSNKQLIITSKLIK